MNHNSLNDDQIVNSWHKNAVPWTTAVREKQIKSREVTDKAIIEAIESYSPNTVLDLGCGEGWLVRHLTKKNIKAIGVDAVADLIIKAEELGVGKFQNASYEEIIRGKLNIYADLIVCNFSLFGREIVTNLFKTIPSLIKNKGIFIVQTLHPIVACGDLPYQDGWRKGSWDGFSSEFVEPPAWYFRTLASWFKLFADTGLKLIELREPIDPINCQPASIIFIAQIKKEEYL